jgi:3-hydroxy-3-methylglutaryl CoA synthase
MMRADDMVGIVRFGGYVPRLRLERRGVAAAHRWFAPGLGALGKGERAIANWDEDTVTMAVEAARDCLGGHDRAAVARVVLASTSLPFADRQNAGIVKEGLNLPDGTGALDVSASQRAGTSALLDAFHAVAGGAGDTLCVASERRRARPASEAELTNGDAAAAMLVGTDGLAARFVGGHSLTIDFVDHFRESGEPFDYGWETRWIREEGYGKIVPEAVRQAFAKLDLKPAEIDHFVMAAPLKGVNQAAAKASGIADAAVVDALAERLGDCGAAQPLILLSHLLETAEAGRRIMLVGFGQGCDVIVLETLPGIAERRPAAGVRGRLALGVSEANYLKYLFFSGNLDLERGMRAELDQKPVITALYRDRKTVMGLVGGRSPETGAVQFPKTPIPLGAAAGKRLVLEDYPLADRPARVFSYTADALAYSPDPPAYYGAVEFEGGGRLSTDFTDIGDGGIEVGTPVRMMFRIKAHDDRRGFTKYFWKAAPVRAAADAPDGGA